MSMILTKISNSVWTGFPQWEFLNWDIFISFYHLIIICMINIDTVLLILLMDVGILGANCLDPWPRF